MTFGYKYPIKVVSQMTGLSVHVIRAWEKRYNVVEPERTDTNRRLYSEEDIEKLKLLNDVLQKGHSIGGVANLTSNELKNLLSSNKNGQEGLNDGIPPTTSPEVVENVLSDSIEAIRNYDAKKLEAILLNVSTKLTQPILIEEVIIPLVYKVGELWHSGEIRVANEHLGSSVIRGFLFNLLESYSVSDSQQHHEDKSTNLAL